MSGGTAFRDAITKARREPAGVTPQFEPVQPEESLVVFAEPVDPRYEIRVERLKGSRRRRADRLEVLGRKRWQLVAVDGNFAYLQRRAR